MLTLAEYLKGDNVDEKDYLEDSVPYNDFYDIVKAVPTDHGEIDLKHFFDKKNEGDMEGEAECFVNDLDAFLNKYGDWMINDPDEDVVIDNTYNYGGNIAQAVAFVLIHIVDPDSATYESKTVALMKVCLASDVRGEYSPYGIAIFDESTNITDINYNAFAFLGRRFNVANGTVLINGEKFDLSLDTYALSDTYSIYLSSRENSSIDYDDESGLEFTPDNEDLIDEIKEITDCTDVQLVSIDYETYSEN